MKVLIVGGGPVDLEQLSREIALGPELIIAADSGAKHLHVLGRLPRILIGDFDSIPAGLPDVMVRAGVEILTYPAAKDQTDLELAIDLAIQKNATEVRILGGLGNRLDHTLGNIGLLLKLSQRRIAAFLLDPSHEITVIDKYVKLRKEPGKAVSLIPLTLKVSGVTTTGLRFPLTGAELLQTETRGIHNEFSDQTATVTLSEGILLVIVFQEKETSVLSSQNKTNPI